ncbi:DUF58 domain-containing protein [Agilicoccus flavus]|uniref:DUF58 domain-containing protein n=1 Tax=Agilicoccus flavus TaxID=2775968 RepID=UPI001CF6C24E|nr:DUF58 domain-containing protein [Agilicoccus flavus]
MALTGRAVLLVLCGFVALALAPSGATVRWWVLAVAALVTLDLLLAPRTATLAIARGTTPPLRRFDDGASPLEVTNTGRRRVRAVLRDAWVPSAGAHETRHRLDLAPGATEAVATRLRPTRRGDRPADRVTVRTAGPLGLAWRQRSTPIGGSVRVLPEFASRRHLPDLMSRLRDIEGRAVVRVRGRGSEFDSLRDYVEGDDVRSIDWRATARRRDTVVRTWRPERDRRVVIVLDTSRTSAARVGDAPRLDTGIEATLLLAAVAAGAGDAIDVVAGDQVVRARVTDARRGQVLPRCSEAVAPLQPALVEANWPALVAAATGGARPRSLVVLVTALDPVTVQEGLLPVLPALLRRHAVVLASTRDPELERLARGVGTGQDGGRADDAYLAAAAQHDLDERERTAHVLRRLGVDVVDAEPEDAPRVLAEHYLQLKDLGRL